MKSNDTVTITQIAKESNVSIATVSRVLNGSVPVSPEKKKRVETVIEKYHFSPNAVARSMVSRHTMTIGVILPDITNPYFSSMFIELERCALEAGYSLFLCNTLFGGSSHGIQSFVKESDYFQMMIDKQVDGVLIMGGQIDLVQIDPQYQDALTRLRNHVPVVVIGKEIKGTNCIFINQETGKGVTTAFHYLYTLGHRKIAFVGGQPDVTITNTRLCAYKSICTALNLPINEDLIALSDYYSKDGYDAVSALIQRKADFTALLAINDNVAIGAIRCLSDAGRSVPNDVAVISCDGFLQGEFLTPRLTSIHHHQELLAHIVMSTLLNAMKGLDVQADYQFTPELIIRESCGTNLSIRKFSRTIKNK